MTDVIISEIDEDEKREAALRAEELGERLFNILDGDEELLRPAKCHCCLPRRDAVRQ